MVDTGLQSENIMERASIMH